MKLDCQRKNSINEKQGTTWLFYVNQRIVTRWEKRRRWWKLGRLGEKFSHNWNWWNGLIRLM